MSFLSGGRGGFLGGSVSSTGGTFSGDVTVTGNLVVGGTTAVTGATTLSAPLTLPAGSLAAPALKFTGSDAGTGLSAATPDTVIQGRVGVAQQTVSSNGIASNVSHTMAGTLFLNAAFRPTVVSTATDYTLLTSDRHVTANTGCATITMPASPSAGAQWVIWNNTGGALTLARAGSQTINGATSVSIAAGACVLLGCITTTVFLASESPAA